MDHPTRTPRPLPIRPPRARCGRAAAALLALVALLAAGTAWGQDDPFALVDGALYAGEGGTGRTVLLSLELGEDGATRGTLLEATPPRGAAPGLDFAFEGSFERVDDAIVVRARARPRTTGGAEQTLEAKAPTGPDGALDPFARASLALVGTGTRLELDGVGTVLHGRTELADGSFRIERHAPFFYADPWRTLDLVAHGRLAADRATGQGLAQRREIPRSVAGAWWDLRRATIESFDPNLVSFRVTTDVFTGGAHPNRAFLARILLREEGAWRAVGPCEALAALGRPCEPDAIRRAVIADLRRQGAAWATDGEVDAGTPWLLDLAVLTPRGLRVLFEPYAVGPYAQGPFVVDLEFPLPSE